ncbi:MAG TPA: hypothetical protein VGK17_19190 [Propionicimonas sp.]|jgi:hypothetical protein
MRSVARAVTTVAIGLALAGVSACTAGTLPEPRADLAPSASPAVPDTASHDPSAAATVDPAGPTGTPTAQQTTSTAPTPRPTPAQSTAPVVVTVTTSGWDATAGQLWVSGFVPAPEEGGTCALRVTKGAAAVVVQRSATPDATTTTCGSVTIDRDRLSPGTWSAVLAYQSPARAGAAGPVTIEVP